MSNLRMWQLDDGFYNFLVQTKYPVLKLFALHFCLNYCVFARKESNFYL